MLINDISLTISGKLGGRQTPSGWSTTNCPMCLKNGQSRPDTRKRGGFKISDSTISYHCFNCGFKASWQPGRNLSHKLKKLLRSSRESSPFIDNLKFSFFKFFSKTCDCTLHHRRIFTKKCSCCQIIF